MNPEDFLKSAPGRLVRTHQGYWAFLANPLPPELSWPDSLVSLHSEAERELVRLALSGRDFPHPAILARPFIRTEAVVSSRIEGTQATLEDLYSFEAGQMTFLEGASDAHEVYNYVQALDYGLERIKSLPISLRLIRELHARLMEGVRGEVMTPGEFRRSQNWIGPAGCTLETATYVPPPVEEMHSALDALEKFIHASSDLPALTRIGLIHYQFEAIHPFLDGNGRVGRLLISLLLCHWDLLPRPLLHLSVYFERNQRDYYERLLAVSRLGDWEGWLRFFLRGVCDQSREAAGRVQALQQVREQYRNLIAGRRSSRRLLEAVDLLIGTPILTARGLQTGLHLADFKAAQRLVDVLAETGILREASGRKRNRIYRAERVLAALR